MMGSCAPHFDLLQGDRILPSACVGNRAAPALVGAGLGRATALGAGQRGQRAHVGSSAPCTSAFSIHTSTTFRLLNLWAASYYYLVCQTYGTFVVTLCY